MLATSRAGFKSGHGSPKCLLRLDADTNAFSLLNSLASKSIESIVDRAPWNGHYENFRPPWGLLQLHVYGFGLYQDSGYMIDDDSLCAIANTRTLLDLDLSNNQITDDGIVFLRNIWDLRKLNLSNHDQLADADTTSGDNHILGEGFAMLASLRNLHTLKLEKVGLDDIGLSNISCLSSLEKLDLSSNDISGNALHWLTKLRNLRKLDLSANSNIGGECLNVLRPLHNLKCLDISHLCLSDPDVSHVADLGNLTDLWLCGNQLTPASFEHLYRLNNLRNLHIWNNPDIDFDDQAVQKLKSELPNCTIKHGDLLAGAI